MPIKSAVDLWIDDTDSSNIDRLGHRRWLFYPNLGEIGFGRTEGYTAVHVIGGYKSGNYEDTGKSVAWPARYTPTKYFSTGTAWSISMGRYVDKSQLKVTVKRESDGKKWVFASASSDGYFNVDNNGYGDPGCIIFHRPDCKIR